LTDLFLIVLGMLRNFLRGDEAVDGFEHLLVVGTVVVVLVGGLILGFEQILPQVVGLACPAIDTASTPAATAGSCLVP
jgi:hypothetical protein